MATLINFAASSELKLVQIVGETLNNDAFITACEGHISKADAPSLMKEFLKPPIVDGIFGFASEEDVEGAFGIVTSLLRRCNPTDIPKASGAIANAVTTTTVGDAGVKLRVLANLYNLVKPKDAKFPLLKTILKFAGATDQCETLGAIYADPENTANELSLGAEDRRSLYLVMSETHPTKKQEILTMWLKTFDASTVTLSADDLKTATACVAGAVANPLTLFLSADNLMDMGVIDVLRKESSTSALVALLEVFVEGKLEDFNAFAKKNAGVLKSQGLAEDACVKNIRLLSLCSLATDYSEIPYSVIASTLQVEESEVETWVIAAVTAGLIAGRMDEMRKVVSIERSVHRKFGTEEWKELQTKLNTWTGNIAAVREQYIASKSRAK